MDTGARERADPEDVAVSAAGDFDGGAGGRAVPTVDPLPHAASCWRPRPNRSRLGRRAGGELVEEPWCIACGATLRLVDGEPETAGPPDPPTALAAEKIPEIEALWRESRSRRLSKTVVAQRVGIDRGTLEEWIRRKWLPWAAGVTLAIPQQIPHPSRATPHRPHGPSGAWLLRGHGRARTSRRSGGRRGSGRVM